VLEYAAITVECALMIVRILLALGGCRPGPKPKIGALHEARTNWRPECSHCWVVLLLGYAILIGLIAIQIIIWTA
jgi:hypothetical protein